jgi:hypothetical protein
MNPMIPFACLVSFVLGGVAAWAYLSPFLVDVAKFNAQYEAGLVAGRRMAAHYLECAAESEIPARIRVQLAEELRSL